MDVMPARVKPPAPADRPRIPEPEYRERLAAVQHLAEQRNLDALVIYGDDRATMGAAHVRWLFDYFPHFEPIAFIVAPGKSPVAVTGPESISYVDSSSRFDGETFATHEFVLPGEEYSFTTVRELARVLDDLLGTSGSRRLGIVGSGMIGARLFAAFDSLATETVDLDRDYGMIRAIKSPAELAVVGYAYRIAEQATVVAFETLAAGTVTEREVGAEIDHTLRLWGAEGTGIDTIVASGLAHTYPILHRTSTRLVGSGDLVILTIAPRYEGYHGAIGRTIFVGDVDPTARRARAVAIDAQAATREILRPGATAHDIDAMARGVVGEAGFGDYFLYTGIHSIGTAEFEVPILAGFDTTVLEPNMVFSIDIPMFHTPWGGLRIEDGFHVQDAGAVPFQTLPAELDVD